MAARVALAVLLASGLGTGPSPAPGEWTRAFHRGDYLRAIALAGERIRAQPGDVQARIILARAEAAQGRFESAYAEFDKALRIDPRSTDALYYLGITTSSTVWGSAIPFGRSTPRPWSSSAGPCGGSRARRRPTWPWGALSCKRARPRPR